MTLLEQARELLRRFPYSDGDSVKVFLEGVIPVLEALEKREELIGAFRAANKPGQIIAVPDERAERRKALLYKHAVEIWLCATWSVVPDAMRVQQAVTKAEELLAEVEKRG